MTPNLLLQHIDSGQAWTTPSSGFTDMPSAYQRALQVRALRIARGEVPKGFKIGFTNRTIWPRYGVFAPIWGTVWDTTVTHCDGEGVVSIANTCQPRIEPETVFGMRATPPANATLEQLFDAIDWIAPGFEVVQSHMPDWKFAAPDTAADSGLHARLLIGRKLPLREVASSADALNALLGNAEVTLHKGDVIIDHGRGSNVLDSPLRALHYFLAELRRCPGAPDLSPGDVITTGTWTDAWPILPGDTWSAQFSIPGFALNVSYQ